MHCHTGAHSQWAPLCVQLRQPATEADILSFRVAVYNSLVVVVLCVVLSWAHQCTNVLHTQLDNMMRPVSGSLCVCVCAQCGSLSDRLVAIEIEIVLHRAREKSRVEFGIQMCTRWDSVAAAAPVAVAQQQQRNNGHRGQLAVDAHWLHQQQQQCAGTSQVPTVSSSI